MISRYLERRLQPEAYGGGRLSRDLPSGAGAGLEERWSCRREHVGVRPRQKVGPVHGRRSGEAR